MLKNRRTFARILTLSSALLSASAYASEDEASTENRPVIEPADSLARFAIGPEDTVPEPLAAHQERASLPVLAVPHSANVNLANTLGLAQLADPEGESDAIRYVAIRDTGMKIPGENRDFPAQAARIWEVMVTGASLTFGTWKVEKVFKDGRTEPVEVNGHNWNDVLEAANTVLTGSEHNRLRLSSSITYPEAEGDLPGFVVEHEVTLVHDQRKGDGKAGHEQRRAPDRTHFGQAILDADGNVVELNAKVVWRKPRQSGAKKAPLIHAATTRIRSVQDNAHIGVGHDALHSRSTITKP